jgi:hypothetical protein
VTDDQAILTAIVQNRYRVMHTMKPAAWIVLTAVKPESVRDDFDVLDQLWRSFYQEGNSGVV